MSEKNKSEPIFVSKETREERIAMAKAILEQCGGHQIIIVTVDLKRCEIAASAYGANHELSVQSAALGQICLDAVTEHYDKTIPNLSRN